VFFAECEKLDLTDPDRTAANARLVEYLGLEIDAVDFAKQPRKGEARTGPPILKCHE
jgi:hypothetical protein